uniref:Immunoglobulin domain-containing protein n=1 Tax=Amphiprion percula TaxID=161767 RepID=A0A3P8THF8_AMPPE
MCLVSLKLYILTVLCCFFCLSAKEYITAVVGQNVILPCKVPNNNKTIRANMFSYVSLVLKDVMMEDAGRYECYVLQGETTSKTVYLEVHPPGYVTKSETKIQIRMKTTQRFRLNCRQCLHRADEMNIDTN